MILYENGQYYLVVDDELCRSYGKVLDARQAFDKRRSLVNAWLFRLIMGDIFLAMTMCVGAIAFPEVDSAAKAVVIVCGFIGLGLMAASILTHTYNFGVDRVLCFDLKETKHAMLSGDIILVSATGAKILEAAGIFRIVSF